MGKTKIKGLRIEYNDNYIIIYDAYKINNKEKMINIITEAFEKNVFCKIKRNMSSMTRQWSTRNRLFRLGIFKRYTKDYKIKIKQNPISVFFCFIFGFEHKRRIKKFFIRTIKKIKNAKKGK